MSMMGNPQQMGINNDAQKSLGVPPDMMMSFPFGMNLPPQGKLTNTIFLNSMFKNDVFNLKLNNQFILRFRNNVFSF